MQVLDHEAHNLQLSLHDPAPMLDKQAPLCAANLKVVKVARPSPGLDLEELEFGKTMTGTYLSSYSHNLL